MRYLPHTEEEITEMLQVVGVDSLEDLFIQVPEDCCCRLRLDLPAALTEWELNAHMDRLAGRTASAAACKNYMGAGSYEHFIPAVVPHLLSRGEFVTAYTPYQPEMSQGTLQGIFEYQTLTARLLGMEVANASMYDGASALAEALLMACRITRKRRVAVSKAVHPHYRRVAGTYFAPTEYAIEEFDFSTDGRSDPDAFSGREDLAAVALQSPNFFGCIEDLRVFSEKTHAAGALFITAFTEPLAYGLLKNPGNLGADIACGEGQSLGIPQSFGGPGLGMFAAKMTHVRNMPGRLVGKTTDMDGKRGFVLTLSTREQHIRREKATSNICTNNSLCALSAAMYMAVLGKTGFRNLAQLNLDKSAYLKDRLAQSGFSPAFAAPTFNEFTVEAGPDFEHKRRTLMDKGILAGVPLAPYYPALSGHYLFCVTETKTQEDLDALVAEVTS
jgi:glycine dehydrogenase subunit 1